MIPVDKLHSGWKDVSVVYHFEDEYCTLLDNFSDSFRSMIRSFYENDDDNDDEEDEISESEEVQNATHDQELQNLSQQRTRASEMRRQRS